MKSGLRLQLVLGSGGTISVPAEWADGWDEPGFVCQSYYIDDNGEFIKLPNGFAFIVISRNQQVALNDKLNKLTISVSAGKLGKNLTESLNWHAPPEGYKWEQCFAPQYTLKLEGLI